MHCTVCIGIPLVLVFVVIHIVVFLCRTGIRQYVCSVAGHPVAHVTLERKVTALTALLNAVNFNQCLVFSNYQFRSVNQASPVALEVPQLQTSDWALVMKTSFFGPCFSYEGKSNSVFCDLITTSVNFNGVMIRS